MSLIINIENIPYEKRIKIDKELEIKLENKFCLPPLWKIKSY